MLIIIDTGSTNLPGIDFFFYFGCANPYAL